MAMQTLPAPRGLLSLSGLISFSGDAESSHYQEICSDSTSHKASS
jgi:hypothetical protein